MRSAPASLAVAACLALAGCAAPSESSPAASTASLAAVPSGGSPTPQQASGVRVPEGAALSILCASYTGASHAADARQAKAFASAAAEGEGVDPQFYVVHNEDRSVLYHGFYTTDDAARDRREAERLERDRQLIERMGTRNTGPEGGLVKAFPQSLVVPLEQPDPIAPPEFDLRNSDAFWTVAIGVYTDPALRKRAAVDSVVEARKAGVEAYYLHDGNFSYVTVGAWPATAVREGVTSEQANNDANRGSDYDPRPLVIAPGGQLPEQFRGMTDARGRRATELEVRLEVVDPTLFQTLGAYDYDVDGYNEGDDPLLVNVPASLRREAPAARELPAAAAPADVDALLTRPPGF